MTFFMGLFFSFHCWTRYCILSCESLYIQINILIVTFPIFNYNCLALPWRRKGQSLSGESCGQGNLVGCCPWGHTELDTTELTSYACMRALEKEMATHSSILVWRFPGTGEPGGLPSMGSHRVGHDWRNLAAAALPCNPTRIEIFEIGDLVFFFYCIHRLSEIVPELNLIHTKSISLVINSLKSNFSLNRKSSVRLSGNIFKFSLAFKPKYV